MLSFCTASETSDDVFITPKPTRLIQRILQIATDKDSLILDSFAGSGTTAHAVLKQNAEDGVTAVSSWWKWMLKSPAK